MIHQLYLCHRVYFNQRITLFSTKKKITNRQPEALLIVLFHGTVALVGFFLFGPEQEWGRGFEKVFLFCRRPRIIFYFAFFLSLFFQVSEDHDWDGERVVMTDRYHQGVSGTETKNFDSGFGIAGTGILAGKKTENL